MRATSGVPWLRIAAGVTAIVGAIATLVACIVPYGVFPDPTGGPTTSSSIFNGGFSGAGWDIPEPVFVVLAAAVAAVLILVVAARVEQAISSGLLLALGAQSVAMWTAYVGLAGSQGTIGAGGVIGLGAAFVLLAAGVLALANVLSRSTTLESGGAGAS